MMEPERKDVARNRERILQAAKALFAERGLGVTLHEIAARAGVGVGTIYRHYPNKTPLIEAVFAEQLAELTAIFEEALEQDDPWESVVWCHERQLEHQARNRGLRELLLGTTPEAPDRARPGTPPTGPASTGRSSIRLPRGSSNAVGSQACCGPTAKRRTSVFFRPWLVPSSTRRRTSTQTSGAGTSPLRSKGSDPKAHR